MKFRNKSGFRLCFALVGCKKGQLIVEAGAVVELNEEMMASFQELYKGGRFEQYFEEYKEPVAEKPKAEEPVAAEPEAEEAEEPKAKAKKKK